MGRRHSNLGSGSPRGSGHYSDDGRRWWEDGLWRWFPVTDQEGELEIEVEDVGATSLPARLWTTLVTQYGTPYYRFVGRARSADPHRPTYQVTGAASRPPGWRTPAAREHGPQTNGAAWRSCTNSCSGRDGDRPAMATGDGRGATGGRWST